MSSAKSRLRVVSAIAALALAVSCQGFFPPHQIESITISPTTATVPVNGTFQMEAFGVDTTGNQLGSVTNKVTWMSSDKSQITVGQNTGLLTGVAFNPGATAVTITASYQALTPQTATANVCVEGATDLVIVPATENFSTAQTFPGFTASVQVSGQTLDVTTAVTWISSNTTELTITGGTNPATTTVATILAGSPSIPVTVTATYVCATSSLSSSVVITFTP